MKITCPEKFKKQFNEAIEKYSPKHPERLVLTKAGTYPQCYQDKALRFLMTFGDSPEEAHNLRIVRPNFEVKHEMEFLS